MTRKNLSKKNRQQDRVGMKGLYPMEISEIAAELGSSQDSVKRTLKQAMKKLRDGRANPIKELAVAREKEARHGLPRIDYERL